MEKARKSKASGPVKSIQEQWNKLSVKWHTFIFVFIASVFYFIRASDYILRPQLYAEDGIIWLADAYHLGFKSIFMPLNGFFHFPERLLGFIAAHISLYDAPLIFNLAGAGIFVLMAYYFFTPRTKLFNTMYEKLFFLAAICLIANVNEFFFNFSNSIFLLGIIGVLIMLAIPAKNTWVRVLEKSVFFLSCFTLIFAWLFVPIALVEKYKNKKKVNFYLYSAAAGAIAQFLGFLFTSNKRTGIAVQALFSKNLVLEIYNQIAVPAIRFSRHDVSLDSGSKYKLVVVFFVVSICIAAYLYVLKVSNRQARYLLLFLGIMTIASLKSPLIAPELHVADPLKFMAVVRDGDRYFIFGIIALYIVFAKISYEVFTPKARYPVLAALLLFSLFNSMHSQDFFVNKHFLDLRPQYRYGISRVKAGDEVVIIRVNPINDMILKVPRVR